MAEPLDMPLPLHPMKPVLTDQIIEGEDWGHQIKWDGVRMLVRVRNGSPELYSGRLLLKNAAYPELVQALSSIKGQLLLDGEVIVFDRVKERPVFQKVLQRERMRSGTSIAQAGIREPVQYVIFDLLAAEGKDLRHLPYRQRHEMLLQLFPEKQERYFVTDLFPSGQPLWSWVEKNGWEGIVSKRLSSPYREGKKHKDWFKKKTALLQEVTIAGYTFHEGRLASLIMTADGLYFGRVSLGLTEEMKRMLLQRRVTADKKNQPFSVLPSDLKGTSLGWLEAPFTCTVTGLEVTDAGLLRHPKLVAIPGIM